MAITEELEIKQQVASGKYSAVAQYLRSLKEAMLEPTAMQLRQGVMRGAVLRSRDDLRSLAKYNLLPDVFPGLQGEEPQHILRAMFVDYLEAWKNRIAEGFLDGTKRHIGSIIYTPTQPKIAPIVARVQEIFAFDQSETPTAIVSWNGRPVTYAAYVAAAQINGVILPNDSSASQLMIVDNGVLGWARTNENARGDKGAEARHALNIEEVRPILGV